MNSAIETCADIQTWDYLISSMRFRSQVFLPELPQAVWNGEPDVVVHRIQGNLEEFEAADTGIFWKTAPGLFRINVDDVAEYLVKSGNEVFVRPEKCAAQHDVAAFLLGSAMGALLYQRGLLPLHAGAVQTERGAVLFAGHSGAGKSTLTAGLQKRGYPVIADDISAVDFDSRERPIVAPAFPWMKVCEDAALHIGVDSSGLHRDASGRKFITPVEKFASEFAPLERVFILGITEQNRCESRDLSGSEALSMLSRATYRRKFIRGLGVQNAIFAAQTRLTTMVPITNLLRPDNLESLDSTLDEVESILS